MDEDEAITANELIVRVQNQYFEAVQLLELSVEGPAQQVQLSGVFMPASGRSVYRCTWLMAGRLGRSP